LICRTFQQTLQAGVVRSRSTRKSILFLAFLRRPFAIKVPSSRCTPWLPDAHVERPRSSVILAGVLLKMGTVRHDALLLPLFPAASRKAAPYVAVLAIVGII